MALLLIDKELGTIAPLKSLCPAQVVPFIKAIWLLHIGIETLRPRQQYSAAQQQVLCFDTHFGGLYLKQLVVATSLQLG